VVVSSKGKKTGKNKIKQNHTKQNKKKPHKVSQVQMQYSFSKFFSRQVLFGCFLIKGREREKKESGDSSVNGYLRLWLTCPLLSACCCWRLY
jgi:hypothetical protein